MHECDVTRHAMQMWCQHALTTVRCARMRAGNQLDSSVTVHAGQARSCPSLPAASPTCDASGQGGHVLDGDMHVSA